MPEPSWTPAGAEVEDAEGFTAVAASAARGDIFADADASMSMAPVGALLVVAALALAPSDWSSSFLDRATV